MTIEAEKDFAQVHDGRLAEEQPGAVLDATNGIGMSESAIRVLANETGADDQVVPAALPLSEEDSRRQARVAVAIEDAVSQVARERGITHVGLQEHVDLMRDSEVIALMLTSLQQD